MPHKVNLDALICREDFEVIAQAQAQQQVEESSKLKIVEKYRKAEAAKSKTSSGRKSPLATANT